MKKILVTIACIIVSLCSATAQTFGSQVVLADDIFGITNLGVTNFDDNPTLDIVASKSDDIVILSNVTATNVESRQDIELEERAFSVKAVDIDADGDMDIICGAYFGDDFIYLIENDNGEFLTPSVITENVNGPIDNAIIDLDDDGLLDIIVSARFGDELVWLKNTGDNTFAPKEALISSLEAPADFKVVDFDLDGDLDFLIMGATQGYLRWYENQGSLNYNLVQELEAPFRNFFTICDLNNDGLPDVIADKTNATVSGASYYENQNDFNFTETKIVGSPNNNTFCSCADINTDGNMDLLFSDFQNDVLELHIGIGNGLFSDEITLEGNFAKPSNTSIVDFDGDGDLDIIAADEDKHSISLFENALVSNTAQVSQLNFAYSVQNNNLKITSQEGSLNYQILTQSGVLITDGSLVNQIDIDISHLPMGIYLLQVFTGKTSSTRKFFKK